MSSVSSLNAQQAQEQAWELYLQEQKLLQKEDQAIGNAGNPNFNPSSDTPSTGLSNSF